MHGWKAYWFPLSFEHDLLALEAGFSSPRAILPNVSGNPKFNEEGFIFEP